MQPIILAGGLGSRLYPISKPELPKQFIKLASQYSFFQQTIMRLRSYKPPIIIGNYRHRDLIYKQIKEIGARALVVLETKITGTYIPIIFGTSLANYFGSSIVGIFPTDHFIDDTENFIYNIDQAIKLSHLNKIITFGKKGNFINKDYGHIIATKICNNIFAAKKFIEKPIDKILIDNYFWNLGIFIFNHSFLNDLIARDISITKSYLQNVIHTKDFIIDKQLYSVLNGNSFDVLTMNRLSDFYMIKADFDWIDIGNINNILAYYETVTDQQYSNKRS